MNKIEKFIQELCPEGVPTVRLVDLASYVRGLTYSKSDELDGGPIRVLRSNNIDFEGSVLNFESVKTLGSAAKAKNEQLLRRNDILISAASGSRSHVGKVAYIHEDMDFYFGGFMAVLRSGTDLDSRYLFHVLTSSKFRDYLDQAVDSTTINNLNAQIMGSFPIPLPPVQVQQELVSILDKFTELEAELEAELQARGLQIESVRSGIVHGKDPSDYELGEFQLGDLVELVTERKTLTEETDSLYVGVEDLLKDKRGVQPSAKVVPKGSHLSFHPGDTLIGNIRPYLRKIWFADQDGLTNGDVLVFRVKPEAQTRLLPAYLREILLSEEFFEFMIARSKGAKMPRGDKAAALTFRVSLPHLDQQLEFSNKLSALSNLVSSSIIGLPAEIQARRKQYEFYRNKLLTFKELGAA